MGLLEAMPGSPSCVIPGWKREALEGKGIVP